MDLHFFPSFFFPLPQVSQLLSTPYFLGCLLTQGRFVYFSERNSFVILSQRMCPDFFFQPQKIDNFLYVCLKHAWHRLRSCPTCQKKAQDVSVKVSPSMYLSKSQKRKPGLAYEFSTQRSVRFFHTFLVKGSQRSNPPELQGVFQSLFFLLASYPKFQIHIPFVDTSIFCVHSCLTRNLRLRRLACHLICWALPLEISQCCAWNLNHQFLWHSMLNEGRCGWFYPCLKVDTCGVLHTFQVSELCV